MPDPEAEVEPTDSWALSVDGVLIGITAWTEPTLVASGSFYPPDMTSAADRLRYYAARFPIAEIDATYYAPPAERTAQLWAQRTPPRFCFDVKAFRLLTEHPTPPSSLWRDLRDELPAELANKRNVYVRDLGEETYREALDRFCSALTPLMRAGKLGILLFQFPPYFHPNRRSLARLEAIASRIPPSMQAAIEFRQCRWLDAEHCDRTQAFLREHGLAYVCVDEPQGFPSSVPPVALATSHDVSVVRFHGRNERTWQAKNVTAAERFAYDYPRALLRDWVPKLKNLREETDSVHALMNNCYSDYGIRNGRDLAALVTQDKNTTRPA